MDIEASALAIGLLEALDVPTEERNNVTKLVLTIDAIDGATLTTHRSIGQVGLDRITQVETLYRLRVVKDERSTLPQIDWAP